MKYIFLLGLCTIALVACDKSPDGSADEFGFTAPTPATSTANADVLKALSFEDRQDFIEAHRGLIAKDESLVVASPELGTIWDQTAYDFIQGKSPDSVNPSLWRQAKLNNIHGLFEVTDGIYQLRGYDIANMTLIDGDTGWIVVDPLTSKETAQHAFEFAMQHLEIKPIVAIIFTHSHADHYGGATALATLEDVEAGRVRVIAPEGFMEEVVSETAVAGIAQFRRGTYMYGKNLPLSVRGHIDSGLGKGVGFGSSSILPPTTLVSNTLQEETIDGVTFVFQNAEHTEAPAELTFYLPHQKAWCGAELVSRQMHNIYTLRGAKVRDSLNWSNTVGEVIDLFGETEVYFASHHWPIWGNDLVVDFLEKQRDMYKYIHDQTVRLGNAGLTPREIAEQLQLPETLRNNFSNRGYYGSVSHNAKAVYQFYWGWYDGNPANLNPLPPVESSKKMVEFMGGPNSLLTKAQESFDNGEYRWVAEVLNQLVFADPSNASAKALLARTYDQLGYIAESGPWRDIYLSGAYELRHGVSESGINMAANTEQLRFMPVSNFLDAIAASLDGPEAEGENLVINFVFTDINESYVLRVKNAVLHHKQAEPDPDANATVTLTHSLFVNLLTQQAGITGVLFGDALEFSGSKLDLIRFFSLLDLAEGNFNIVLP